MTEEVTNPDLRSQDERQLDLIRDLNSRVPSNPQGDAADAGLKKILQSLSKNSLSDALRDSFSADKLKEWKEYAEKEFEAMGQINRKRVRNLVGLSDEDMHRTMFEGFFLFDINPLDAPTVEVQARTGEFDDDGKPVMKTFSYEVFQKNALYGLEGVERFVPKSICEGEEGMHAYLKEEYSERVQHFQKAEYKPIKALTTIGSLGGIGHKPDSDMDAQVIINTNPEYRYCWNDADFFLALLCHILERFYDHYFLHVGVHSLFTLADGFWNKSFHSNYLFFTGNPKPKSFWKKSRTESLRKKQRWWSSFLPAATGKKNKDSFSNIFNPRKQKNKPKYSCRSFWDR